MSTIIEEEEKFMQMQAGKSFEVAHQFNDVYDAEDDNMVATDQ